VRLAAPVDAVEYARTLYAALREADALGLRLVVAVPPSVGSPADEGLVEAVEDRLVRASHDEIGDDGDDGSSPRDATSCHHLT